MASCFVASPAFLRPPDAYHPTLTSSTLSFSHSLAHSNLPKVLWFNSPEEKKLGPFVTVKCQKEKKHQKQPLQSGVIKRAQIKALNIILRREAAMANMEKKAGPKMSKKLLPRTVLEALTGRIDGNHWESALKGRDIGSLLNAADIGTELGSLQSFGGKGKTLAEDSGGHAFGEFDVGLSPRGGPKGG